MLRSALSPFQEYVVVYAIGALVLFGPIVLGWFLVYRRGERTSFYVVSAVWCLLFALWLTTRPWEGH